MSKSRIKYKIVAIAAALLLTLTGCGVQAASAAPDAAAETTAAEVQQTAPSKADMFTERDLSGEYDEAEAVKITLNGTSAQTESADGVTIDGSTITITEDGTYILTGTLTDGQIIVDADDAAKVQIVLNGASVTSSSSAALYVKSADKVFVTTAAGTENTLANGGTFTAIDDNNIDGAVFAKDDITFNGSGSLTVTSPAGHGVVGKDDVKFAGGTVTITAASHGVDANDSARFAECDVTITAGEDGVHVSPGSDDTEDSSFFYMADGTLTINAGDDGIHASAQANIEGGDITVAKSYEGIEALSINVSGGNIDVLASDDGFNAAGGSSSDSMTQGSDDWGGGHGGFSDGGTDGSISISGGTIKVTAGGDGIDSNGSVDISGGYTVVQGPTMGDTSVLDYNSTGTVSGGVFIGTGGSGMAESFSGAENQGIIAVSVGNQSAGTTVSLKDGSGNVIAEVTPELDYAVVYISAPEVTQGSTYTLTAGSYSETITLDSAIYSTIGGGFGGMQGGSPMGDMNQDPRQLEGNNGGMQGRGPRGGGPGQGGHGGQDGMNGQNGNMG